MRRLGGTRQVGAVLALVAVTLAGTPARPAAAFEATGTWRGTLRCSGQVANARRSFAREDVELRISGPTLQLESRTYEAASLPDPRKPERGALALIGCLTSVSPDFHGQMGRVKVSTRPSTGAGNISGTLFSIGDSIAESFFTCRWNFHRVSTVDPGVAPCP